MSRLRRLATSNGRRLDRFRRHHCPLLPPVRSSDLSTIREALLITWWFSSTAGSSTAGRIHLGLPNKSFPSPFARPTIWSKLISGTTRYDHGDLVMLVCSICFFSTAHRLAMRAPLQSGVRTARVLGSLISLSLDGGPIAVRHDDPPCILRAQHDVTSFLRFPGLWWLTSRAVLGASRPIIETSPHLTPVVGRDESADCARSSSSSPR